MFIYIFVSIKGYDDHYGFQLYQSDPSGNFSGWKATVIGTLFLVSRSVSILLSTYLYIIIVVVTYVQLLVLYDMHSILFQIVIIHFLKQIYIHRYMFIIYQYILIIIYYNRTK